jgi:uncharacterized protein (DUF983 family)
VDEPAVPTNELTIPRLLWRGVRRRCPLCGGGRLFDSWFRKKERCPRCNFPLAREEGHWIGALGMNTVATVGMLALTMLVVVTLTWDHRRGILIFGPTFAVGLLTPILFFGSSQTLWSAIDLAMRPLEPDDDVDPRWIPPAKQGPGW